MPVIEVRNIHKRYGNQVAVRHVSFGVEQGEIRCGKRRNRSRTAKSIECISRGASPIAEVATRIGVESVETGGAAIDGKISGRGATKVPNPWG